MIEEYNERKNDDEDLPSYIKGRVESSQRYIGRTMETGVIFNELDGDYDAYERDT